MSLLNDKPIHQPKDDKFGFSPFAEAIAQAIVKNKNPEGTVIAVHGPWGSGKSSVINLVKYHLERKMESQQSQGALGFRKRLHRKLQSLLPQWIVKRSNNGKEKRSGVPLQILKFNCWAPRRMDNHGIKRKFSCRFVPVLRLDFSGLPRHLEHLLPYTIRQEYFRLSKS